MNQAASPEQKATGAGVKEKRRRTKGVLSTHGEQKQSQEAWVQVSPVSYCLKILDASVFQASFSPSVKSGEESLAHSPLRLVKTSQENACDNSLGTEKCHTNGRASY